MIYSPAVSPHLSCSLSQREVCTYVDKRDRTVCIGGSSGLDKYLRTAQLTVFADGDPRAKPVVIFRGTGKSITLEERTRYDQCVTVQFLANAWCDETVMLLWITCNWKQACSGPMHLIADVHRVQKTESILNNSLTGCP